MNHYSTRKWNDTWKTLMSFSSPLRLISNPLSSAKVPSWLKTAYRFLSKTPSSFDAGIIIAWMERITYYLFVNKPNSSTRLKVITYTHTLYGPSTSNSMEHSLCDSYVLRTGSTRVCFQPITKGKIETEHKAKCFQNQKGSSTEDWTQKLLFSKGSSGIPDIDHLYYF